MINMLVQTLAAIDKPTVTWSSPDGSKLLMLPYGGRILGLFAPDCARNFLWTHPALRTVESARAFYKSREWHNSGGDRTWLSPEIDFFLPEFPRLDTYVQPRAFDPGNYQLIRESGLIAMVNRFFVQLSRSKRTLALGLTKRVKPANNPLRHIHPALCERLKYAGYTLKTRLQFETSSADIASIGIWNLLQLPHGGELLIPTFSRTVPTVYMGCLDDGDLKIGNHLIRYQMHAVGEHKLGIQAPAAIGRVGYLQSDEGGTSLVIRNFSINPSGEYVDTPWKHPEWTGSVIQACSVKSNLGEFSELEYHAPAISGLPGDSCCEDESQVWAFYGAKQDIVEAGRLLISPDI